LQFEAGKKYALIGQNKAGKSTLTKIICKLYKPDEGYIALNGIPYSEIPRVVLRNLISYIPQKAFIFPGTIRENILVGNPNATEEERKSLA
jgi:ABC-type multidrug transport system fused ATPase/permease subunit